MFRTQERAWWRRGYGAARTIGTVIVAVLWLVKALLMGAGEALVAFFQQLKLLALTLTPGQESELESDRAGRAAELRVAALFEGIPGVQVFTSLRIPDTGQGRGRREIDLVLVTKRDLFVVEVKNWSGAIELQPDGSWLQIRRNGTSQKHSNVVDGTKYRALLLKSYIEKRGVNVPSGFVQPKVFLVNPDCRPEQAIVMQPEVLSADQWENFLENNLGRTGSGWMSSLFGSQQSDSVLPEASEKQLLYILSTAPTWDRLELYGGKIVVGDFHSFQGQAEEVQALKFAKRTVVKQLTMTHRRGWVGHTLGLFIGRTPKVKIAVTVRDHREANPTKPSKKQDRFGFPLSLEVRPDLEIVFQPVANPKPVHYNLNDVLSLTLSA